MNVLLLNHNVAWRSTFFRCLAFGRQLVRRGHRVTLVTTRPSGRFEMRSEEVDGVELALMPDLGSGMARSGWDPSNVLRRLLFLRGRRFDLVHAFDCRPVVVHPALLASRLRSAPLVIDWADWWGRGGAIAERSSWLLRHGFGPIETFYEEHYRRRADWTTAISSALADRVAGLGVDPDRVTVIPGGADLERFAPLPRDAARARLGLPLEAPLVLFAGFVQYDLDLVLESFDVVASEVPGARLVLCGPPSPVVRAFQEGHPRLAGRVLEAGVVGFDLMPAYLAAADVLLLPLRDSITNRGRWPNKLGEYLAMGQPVVTNPTGDVGALLERTGAGRLAGSDPAAFGDAVVRLLRDPEARRELGRRARATAEEELDYAILARRLLDVYGKVLGASGG
ncbi:MAG: glycosyltransferase family 4 protein [bacterium]|jgi:glycosyltransferase involved in cell wall biosynthesis|nr:glycosyltransferase family 4 protein [bacterium]